MVHNMVLNVVLNLVLNSISFFRTESTYFQELCKVSKQKKFFVIFLAYILQHH